MLWRRRPLCLFWVHLNSRALSTSKPSVVQQRIVESLWRELLSDPSNWWDNRPEKVNPRYPDFTHKKTHESLWLNGNSNPAWVVEEVNAMAPGVVQMDGFGWNKRLARYVKMGCHRKAMEYYQQMQVEGIKPDRFTFVSILNSCSALQALAEGRQIHMQIIKSGCKSEVYVGNCLVDMYGKCGSPEDAWMVFQKMPQRDVVSWSVMIRAWVKCGQGQKALELFWQMQRDGVDPDPITLVGAMNACASVASLEEGHRVHQLIIENGHESDIFLGNSTIDMYGKCGSLEDAWRVFKNMPQRDVISWSAMIRGCVKCGQGKQALELFTRMQAEGLNPDPVTFVGILNACASIAGLEVGRQIHGQIIQRGFESNVFVGSSLIDMYSKCGSIEDARRVFHAMPTWNAVSWNAVLGGYALHGQVREALGIFERMCQEGVKINDITLVSLLSACSHGGLVDEALQYFESMSSMYSVFPTTEHYVCMVDLLGRAGCMHAAEDLIMEMSFEADASLWISLLAACRNHGNVEMGERIAKQCLDLDPDNAGAYLLLSNIYTAAGKWDKNATVKQKMLGSHVKQEPGRSWIELND